MQAKNPPKWLKTVAVLAILWNAMGILNFIMQISATPETLALLPADERALYENTPTWSFISFALGVFGGTIGSVGLVLRKQWARPFFLVSLIAVVSQMSYWLFLTPAVEVYGPSSYIMPTIVIVIAILLLQITHKGIKQGYIE